MNGVAESIIEFLKKMKELGGSDVVEKFLEEEISFEMRKNIFNRKGFFSPGKKIYLQGFHFTDLHQIAKPLYIDYFSKLSLINDKFPIEFNGKEFKDRGNALIGSLQNNKEIKNILNGPYLPVVLPKIDAREYTDIFETYLYYLAKECSVNCSSIFSSSEQISFKKKIAVSYGSGHGELVKKLREKSRIGLCFFPFPGYSVSEQRESMNVLEPLGFTLGGGIDTIFLFLMYRDVLFSSTTKGITLSACDYLEGLSLQLILKDPGIEVVVKTWDEVDVCANAPLFYWGQLELEKGE